MPAVSSTHSSPALCTQTGYSSFPSPTSINDGCSLSLSLFKYSSAALLVSLAKQPHMLASQTNHTHIHTQIHTRTQSLRRISNSIRRLQHRVRQPHTHIHGCVYRHTITVTHSLYTHIHTQKTTHKKLESKRQLWQRCMKVCVSDGGGEGDETQCCWTPRLSSLKGTVRHARKFPRIINLKKSIHVLTLNWISDTTETAAGVIVSFERKRCLRLW